MTDHWTLSVLSILIALVALAFVALFAREPWWRHPFGQSVMVLTIAILIFQALAIARTFLGPDYWGREWFLGVGRAFVLVSISQRLWVLFRERRRDRP
jgi:NO-binding membrane sensor protein with MHYT domain